MIEVKNIGMSDPNYKLNNIERETIITFNETGEPAEVFTYNPAMIRRLDALHEEGEPVEVVRAESVNGVNLREYRVPKIWIRVRPPKKMQYTEEQRRERSERMQKLRSEQLKRDHSIAATD